jgi:hypothetical protein
MDGTIQAIIKLWNEARNPLYIAQKLGLIDDFGEPDVEKVEMVIDNPANYPNRKEYQGRQYA